MTTYTCPKLNIDFNEPCDLKSCPAHIWRFVDVGLKPRNETNTNCVKLEFEGIFDEQIDYAVTEQGRVGYRDLEYVSEYFETNPHVFRNLYIAQDRYLRQAYIVVALSSRVDSQTENPFMKEKTRMCVERIMLPALFMVDTLSKEEILNVAYHDYRNKRMLFTPSDIAAIEETLQ